MTRMMAPAIYPTALVVKCSTVGGEASKDAAF
jgi:hypothetical protein